MEPFKILIVEDESLVSMDMVDMLQNLGYDVLPTAITYDEAVQVLSEHTPDLALLDINLGGTKTGVDLARYIRSNYNLPFIFITSHSDKATVASATSTQPNGYIVKPFQSEDLFTSIETALASWTGKANAAYDKLPTTGKLLDDCLFVKTDRNFVKVKIAEILYLQSDQNYLYIVTEKGKHIVRSSFKEFLENLPKEQFLQVHKSYIINLGKIESFSHTEVVVKDAEIPLSRNYKDELFERINRII